MTERKIHILSCLLSFVLGVGIGVGSFGIARTIINKSPVEIVIPDKEGMKDSYSEKPLMGVAVKSVSLLKAETYSTTQGVSKTLTAEIKPSDAQNKAVDWTVAWTENSITENISDYLTIEPTSDGALTATVTCKASFRGKKAVATVTTRDGGFKAFCYISYVGEPTSISINNGLAGSCNLDGSASYEVNLSNVFNDVGSEFFADINITNISFGGTCSTAQKWVTVGGRNEGTVLYTNEKDDVPITSLKYEGDSLFTDNFNISVSNGTLNISAPSVANVYSQYSAAGPGNQDIYYDYFTGNWNGYVDITLSYGLMSTVFRVNFILGVEGVSVSSLLQF